MEAMMMERGVMPWQDVREELHILREELTDLAVIH